MAWAKESIKIAGEQLAVDIKLRDGVPLRLEADADIAVGEVISLSFGDYRVGHVIEQAGRTVATLGAVKPVPAKKEGARRGKS